MPPSNPCVRSFPVLDGGMTFKEVGSSGLRQYGGWVREEFSPNLRGRQGVKI
jgi:hypothetical protein